MQKGSGKTLSKSKVKFSQNTMAVLCQQPAHHDEVVQCFHNIEVLASSWKDEGQKVF